MKKISFKVKSRYPEQFYDVRFIDDDGYIVAECTCKAAQMKQICKHRATIINGSSKLIAPGYEDGIKELNSWVSYKGLKNFLSEHDKNVSHINEQIQDLKEKITELKKQAGVSLEDGIPY